ncbi:unnamed protein product [Lactuca virosa]|uniref:Uncharacterized protein n=1 Tax=Lactuca virosa TaxID=75947 RepID=A0AAU9NTH3_9ASTR|nr:unnamed protein product [Lactuca virosa]
MVFPSSETVHRCAAELSAAATVTLSLSSPEDSFPLLWSAICHLEGLLCRVDALAAVRTVVTLLLFPSDNCLREAIVGSPTTPCDSDDGPEAGAEVTMVFPSYETVHRCAAELPATATVTLSLSSPEDSFPLLRSAICHLEGLLCRVDAPAAVRTIVTLLLFPS